MTVPDISRLSERQHLAIEALLTGGTHAAAATAAGVCRTTVTGWVNHHIPFITGLDRRRQERSAHMSDLMGEALLKAVGVLVERLENGELSAAVALLRLVDPSVLYQRPSNRPATLSGTTAHLAEQLESRLLLESFAPAHAVFAVEDLSTAHADG